MLNTFHRTSVLFCLTEGQLPSTGQPHKPSQYVKHFSPRRSSFLFDLRDSRPLPDSHTSRGNIVKKYFRAGLVFCLTEGQPPSTREPHKPWKNQKYVSPRQCSFLLTEGQPPSTGQPHKPWQDLKYFAPRRVLFCLTEGQPPSTQEPHKPWQDLNYFTSFLFD